MKILKTTLRTYIKTLYYTKHLENKKIQKTNIHNQIFFFLVCTTFKKYIYKEIDRYLKKEHDGEFIK